MGSTRGANRLSKPGPDAAGEVFVALERGIHITPLVVQNLLEMRRVLLVIILVVLARVVTVSAAAVDPFFAPVQSRDATVGVRIVKVTITERRCTLSPATVLQGAVVFRISNRGHRVHVFALAGTRAVAVGVGRTVNLRSSFAKPGRYRYACRTTGRRHGTIVGALTVTAPLSGSSQPCGTAKAQPTIYEHVVWILMENRDYGQIVGAADAPYINQLGQSCGVATNFHAETHPSLPNYIALTSGGTQGIHDDASPPSHALQVASIFSQLGTGWRALQESMPGNCSLSTTDRYAVKHNPAAYYVTIRPQCQAQDVPLADPPDVSARFTFITPNLCSDMHDCSTADGDRWLASWVPKILDSPQYKSGSTALFLTWDEGEGSDNHIATIVISPSTPRGAISNARYDHYSLLRTTEELLGITTYLGEAASAASMRAAFHL